MKQITMCQSAEWRATEESNGKLQMIFFWWKLRTIF